MSDCSGGTKHHKPPQNTTNLHKPPQNTPIETSSKQTTNHLIFMVIILKKNNNKKNKTKKKERKNLHVNYGYTRLMSPSGHHFLIYWFTRNFSKKLSRGVELNLKLPKLQSRKIKKNKKVVTNLFFFFFFILFF